MFRISEVLHGPHWADFFHGATLDLDTVLLRNGELECSGIIEGDFDGRRRTRHAFKILIPGATRYYISDPDSVRCLVIHDLEEVGDLRWRITSEIPGYLEVGSDISKVQFIWDRAPLKARHWMRWTDVDDDYVAPSLLRRDLL